MITRQHRLAIHEAAHAVVAVAQGIHVVEVSLEPPHVLTVPPGGWLEMAEGKQRWLPSNAGDPAQRRWIAPMARAALAGPLADVACFGEISPENADSELAALLVNELQLHVARFIDSDDLMLERWRNQAMRLAGDNYQAIAKVAKQLFGQRLLSGSEVRQIVRANSGCVLRQRR